MTEDILLKIKEYNVQDQLDEFKSSLSSIDNAYRCIITNRMARFVVNRTTSFLLYK